VPIQVLLGNKQVVVLIQLPELAIDHIEVLVGEVVLDQIDVVLELERLEHPEKVGALELGERDLARPGAVDRVVDARDHRLYVAGVELLVVVQELEARVRVHNVLHQRLPVIVHNGLAGGCDQFEKE